MRNLLHLVSIWLLLISIHGTYSEPLTFLEAVSRHFRQGNRYPEDHINDISIKEILKTRYDFIIIGSGPAGSVIANRLSENPDWMILLLEAGRDEITFLDMPMMSGYWQLTDYNWGYMAEEQEGACLGMRDRRCRWPRGKSLGGSSSINYMIYTRGNQQDYDNWARMGNQGWSYDEVLPYFLKSENNLMPELQSSKYHARGGPLNVENVPFRYTLAKSFLQAGEELGIPSIDYNGASPLGFSYIQANIRNGTRCSASKAFLRPIRDRRNLHISLNSRVSRILIDPNTKETLGVEFIKQRIVVNVKARKEVILSAGSLGSPQILMLSGVGPEDHLKELDIPLIQDLKVGHNLQEHVAFFGLTYTINETNGLVADRLLSFQSLAQSVPQLFFKGRGPLTNLGGVEGIGYIRTKYAEDERPDIELLYVTGGLQTDSGNKNGFVKKGLGLSDELFDTVYKPINTRDSWSIWPIVIQPKSRGTIRLKDKNIFHWPIFNANFFSHPQDMKTLVEGIKFALRLAETTAFKKYDSKLHTIPVPGCTSMLFGSDEYWDCASRHVTGTLHHQVGTCKMGPPSDEDAVVDPQLRVYGIKGLRVADASIMPLVPCAHTNAPTYMVGEKAADMIKATWLGRE